MGFRNDLVNNIIIYFSQFKIYDKVKSMFETEKKDPKQTRK